MFLSRSRQRRSVLSPATGLTHFQKGLPRRRIIATKFKNRRVQNIPAQFVPTKQPQVAVNMLRQCGEAH